MTSINYFINKSQNKVGIKVEIEIRLFLVQELMRIEGLISYFKRESLCQLLQD